MVKRNPQMGERPAMGHTISVDDANAATSRADARSSLRRVVGRIWQPPLVLGLRDVGTLNLVTDEDRGRRVVVAPDLRSWAHIRWQIC